MQTTEKELARPEAPAELLSEPVPLTEAEADEIFRLAEAEIQPLLKHLRRERFIGWVQGLVCVSLMLFSIAGIIWQCITYPTTLVILYAVEKPAHLTTTLDIPTRTLAPVTLTRSLTTPTTGYGHQDARAATGFLTFYNGSANPQTVTRGTVFRGSDGIHVSTDQSVTIPAANPPYFGQATIPATTLQTGSTSNIHRYDINGTVSSSLFIKNLNAFTGGRDARTYKAVAPQDIQQTTSMLQATLAQAMPLSFPVARGESVYPTYCVSTTIPSNQPGDEASIITVKVTKTCSALAYNQETLQQREKQLFTTKTKPGTHYTLIGSLQSKLVSVTPLTVQLIGSWVYVISQEYQQYLAENIAGDTPQQARAYLLKTGGIAQASIPHTLPEAMYITFLVLNSF